MSKSKEMNAKHYLENRKRVKLYCLNGQGIWNDKGTGYVFIKKEPPFFLTMINEINTSVLFKLPLSSKVKFHLQRNTIISWKEPLESLDDNFALSFQDIQGVKDICGIIVLLKGKDAIEMKENNDDVFTEVSLENLPFIAREIQPGIDGNKLQKVLNRIKQNNCHFIRQIGKLFDEEERKINEERTSYCSKETNLYSDLGNEEKKMSHMSFIYSIIKNIILIADLELLEKVMNEELCPIIFGVLEYDIESPKGIKHRQYLSEIANFNNILFIKEIIIIKKIQMNYLLIYLKDTVLARFLDRTYNVVINRMIQMNNTDIIQFFVMNKRYLEQANILLLTNNIKIQYKAILFITELINCSKDLFLNLFHFQQLLCQCGFLKVIEHLLIKNTSYNNISVQLTIEEAKLKEMIYRKIIEILVSFITYMPNSVKDHIMNSINSEKKTNSTFLLTLTSILHTDEDFAIKSEISNIIKMLIDANLTGDINLNHIIFTNCLNYFAEFMKLDISQKIYSHKRSIVSSKQIILEILSHCLNSKNDCMIYWFIDSEIIRKILFVLKDQSKILLIAFVQFIRRILETNNPNLYRAIIESGYFNEIFRLFTQYKNKKNLLFSTLMSLFDYLLKETNEIVLISYIFTEFKEVIYLSTNRPYFEQLIFKYELLHNYLNLPNDSSKELNEQLTCDFSMAEKEIEFNDESIQNTNVSKDKLFDLPVTLSFPPLNNNDMIKTNEAHTFTFLGKKHGYNA